MMVKKSFIVVITCILGAILVPSFLSAQQAKYDLVYIWDRDLERVLDYKDELSKLLDPKVAKKLKIVGRNDRYGVIYDRNGSAQSLTQLIVEHGEILREAGLGEAFAVKDQEYFRLYNVSYGYGPNLEALKKTYKKVYQTLGQQVSKNLFIEETPSGNYTLIYRRQGDRRSTSKVAGKHARLLKRKKIATSLSLENSNPIVFGESSLLDSTEAAVIKKKLAKQPAKTALIKKSAIKPPPLRQSDRDRNYPLVKTGGNSGVEGRIEKLIKSLRRKGKIRGDERTGWMVYDLSREKSLVDINANQDFQAASMIKPFVALAFFHQVKKGKLIYGKKSRAKMEAMIQRSNNPATNWVMRQVGGPAKCMTILRQSYGRIFQKTVIREYIPANGRTYKNSASPSDYIRFLRALWNKSLPYSKEVRRLMALPGRDRLYHGTPIPKGTLVYNKTGSTAHLIGDMGILVAKAKNGDRYPYAIVGIVEGRSRPKNYARWMSTRGDVIRQVSTLVYQELKKEHRLL